MNTLGAMPCWTKLIGGEGANHAKMVVGGLLFTFFAFWLLLFGGEPGGEEAII